MKKEFWLRESTAWLLGTGIVILMVLCISLFMAGVKNGKQQEAEIQRLRTENQSWSTIITAKNATIAVQEQRIITERQAKEANILMIKELKEKGIKDVSTIIDLKTEIARLNLEALYNNDPEVIHDTVLINGVSTVKDYLRVPQPWKFEDQWLRIGGTVNLTGVGIDSIITFSEPSIMLGYSRGLLKKSRPIITYEDKNPHDVVRDMSNAVIINKPPFYARPWFYRLEGIVGILAAQWGIRQVSNQSSK